MRRFASSLRLVCDHCGSHHTQDVSSGQLCPLCGLGRLHPIDGRRTNAHAQPPSSKSASWLSMAFASVRSPRETRARAAGSATPMRRATSG